MTINFNEIISLEDLKSELEWDKEQRSSWRKRYHTLRKMAILALGGECINCGETKQDELQIIATTGDSKAWSQLSFYKKIVIAYRKDETTEKYAAKAFAMLMCKLCRYHEMGLQAANRKREKRLAERSRERTRGTGEFFWIAGELVEQVRAITSGTVYGGQEMMVMHPRYEDFKLSWEVEDSA